MIRLTETGEKILEQLAVFRFLTADQLRRLGASPDINHIRQTANRLAKVRPAFLGKMDYGSQVGHGRLPVVYYLTPQGAGVLAELRDEDESKIQYPRGRVDAKTDYHHRLGCVEFRVQLSQALKRPHFLTKYWAYYDYRGANKGQNVAGKLRQLTTFYYKPNSNSIVRVTPDGLFWVRSYEKTGDFNERLFIFEYSRGMATARVVKQFALHHKMATEGHYSKHYDLGKKMPRICWVFDTENAMKAVRKRIMKDRILHDKYSKAVYFKTYDQMLTDFVGGWSYVDPENTATRGLFDG